MINVALFEYLEKWHNGHPVAHRMEEKAVISMSNYDHLFKEKHCNFNRINARRHKDVLPHEESLWSFRLILVLLVLSVSMLAKQNVPTYVDAYIHTAAASVQEELDFGMMQTQVENCFHTLMPQ